MLSFLGVKSTAGIFWGRGRCGGRGSGGYGSTESREKLGLVFLFWNNLCLMYDTDLKEMHLLGFFHYCEIQTFMAQISTYLVTGQRTCQGQWLLQLLNVEKYFILFLDWRHLSLYIKGHIISSTYQVKRFKFHLQNRHWKLSWCFSFWVPAMRHFWRNLVFRKCWISLPSPLWLTRSESIVCSSIFTIAIQIISSFELAQCKCKPPVVIVSRNLCSPSFTRCFEIYGWKALSIKESIIF